MSTPTRWNKIWNWLPGVIITLVVAAILLKFSNWDSLSTSLLKFRPGIFAAIFLLTTLWLSIRAFMWKLLINQPVRWRLTFWGLNVGYLLNNLLPLRAGEIGKSILVGERSGVGSFHVISTVIIERAFDLFFAAGMMLATLPMALGLDSARPIAIFTLAAVALGFLVLFLISRNHIWVKAQAERLGKRWNFFQRVVVPQLDALINGLSVLQNPGRFLACLGLIGATWVIAVLQYYLALQVIAPGAPLWWGAFVNAALAMGVAVPSAPAALGVWEGAIVGALAILNVDTSSALAYAIFMHFMQFTVTAFYSLAGVLFSGEKITAIFRSNASEFAGWEKGSKE